MSQAPVPPPPGPSASSSRRPGIVTAAAVLLILAAILGLLGGLVILTGVGLAAGTNVGGIFVAVGVFVLAVSVLQLYAGVQILGLKERGRMLGIILASLGALLQLASVSRNTVPAIILILVYLFVIYVLVQNRQYFTD